MVKAAHTGRRPGHTLKLRRPPRPLMASLDQRVGPDPGAPAQDRELIAPKNPASFWTFYRILPSLTEALRLPESHAPHGRGPDRAAPRGCALRRERRARPPTQARPPRRRANRVGHSCRNVAAVS